MQSRMITVVTESELYGLVQAHLPVLDMEDLDSPLAEIDLGASFYVPNLPCKDWDSGTSFIAYQGQMYSREYEDAVITPLHEGHGTLAMVLTELMRFGMLPKQDVLITSDPIPVHDYGDMVVIG